MLCRQQTWYRIELFMTLECPKIRIQHYYQSQGHGSQSISKTLWVTRKRLNVHVHNAIGITTISLPSLGDQNRSPHDITLVPTSRNKDLDDKCFGSLISSEHEEHVRPYSSSKHLIPNPCQLPIIRLNWMVIHTIHWIKNNSSNCLYNIKFCMHRDPYILLIITLILLLIQNLLTSKIIILYMSFYFKLVVWYFLFQHLNICFMWLHNLTNNLSLINHWCIF